jgi:O-6-methylguanine DNA methyltransferase
MKDMYLTLNYTLTQTTKGISSLHLHTKKQRTTKLQIIDFSNPEAHVLDMHGTSFQKEVWTALLTIKKGETKTYSDVAKMVGKPTAVRATASAIAKNNIAILIPCHRVIRSDGTLGEYRWGKELKRQLLQNEQNNV